MNVAGPALAIGSALAWALACGGGVSEGGSGPGTGMEGGAAAGGRGGSMPLDAADASDDTGGGFGGLGGTAGQSSADASCIIPKRYLLSVATLADAAPGCEYVWPDELVGVRVGWCSEISVRLLEGDAGTHLSYVGSDSGLCSDAGGWYLVDQRLVFCPATCDAHAGTLVEVTRMCAIPPC